MACETELRAPSSVWASSLELSELMVGFCMKELNALCAALTSWAITKCSCDTSSDTSTGISSSGNIINIYESENTQLDLYSSVVFPSLLLFNRILGKKLILD